jgi:sugar phosphate isomerase/epimerase
MKFGLTAYGTIFLMGIHPKATNPRFTAIQQIDMAEEYGLQGVELPYDTLANSGLAEVSRYAQHKDMFINIAAGGYDPVALKRAIQLGSDIQAQTVRTVVGGAGFGGDRRHMDGKWKGFMEEVLASLQEVTQTAEEAGVNLTVENHQDVASEELLWLCKIIDSKNFGITLDTGNPLATAELPMEFFEKVAPFVKNVHIKDYVIYWSEEGYRLVRCPLGQGVIDFPGLFQLMQNVNPDVTMSIEHGALEARHVRVLQEDYWTEYPPRTARQLTKVLRFVEDHARTKGDWRTPYEQGKTPEEIAAYELDELDAGTAYLSQLIKRFNPVKV